MSKYALGIDFGTLSGRALLADISTGQEAASAVYEYPHAVIDQELGDVRLGRDFALQDPHDYLEVLQNAVPEVIRKSDIDPGDIIGVGIDFTSSTVLPVKADGTPLCFIDGYNGDPHAYAKLWKHHAAKAQAERLEKALAECYPDRLGRYGGKISSEWFFPKIMQTLDEAPHIYAAADRFIEAGDWIVWQLTGIESHCVCAAGFKALWDSIEGYPPNSFWASLDPALGDIIGTKVSTDVVPLGAKVGGICPRMAELTGLKEGTPVASAYIDAHASLPACRITDSGQMLLIIGTSTGHIIVSDAEDRVPGICGVVDGGVIPGKFAYEAGQSAVGDIFDWFVKNCVPASYHSEAAERGIGIHKLLREMARRQSVGESGLLALDWWNGNRSILQDSSLSGMILGLTLSTRPEEIYRALLEATAFGTRRIIENFEDNGVAISKLCAAGGIAAKDDFMMQIYADVVKRPICIAASTQSGALGSAIAGAVAAGAYPDFSSAAQKMGGLGEVCYNPIPGNSEAYDKLYAEYKRLHDYFGVENEVMKRLRKF